MNLDIVYVIGAVGAIGTSAFSIVEGLKCWDCVGLAGFDRIRETLWPEAWKALKRAYGDDFEEVLQAEYRESGTGKRALKGTLRQGIRLGLENENAKAFGDTLKLPTKDEKTFGDLLASAVAGQTAQRIGGAGLSPEHREALGRFELALDARIEASIILARTTYGQSMRLLAVVVSILISFIAAVSYYCPLKTLDAWKIIYAVLIGIAAVPIAPVAKDLASAIASAKNALRGRA